MAIDLTLDSVVAAAEAAVEEKGADFVYVQMSIMEEDEDGISCQVSESCAYVHEEGDELVPGCLVGDVLFRLGVPMEAFIDLEINTDTGAPDALHVLLSVGVIDSVAPAAESFLDRIQCRQDSGSSWGVAIAYGKECI